MQITSAPLAVIACLLTSPAQDDFVPADLGPVIGDVGTTTATLWGRAEAPGPVRFEVERGRVEGQDGYLKAKDETDRTFKIELEDLTPGATYTVSVGGRTGSFTTQREDAASRPVRLAFASCAAHGKFDEQPVWTRLARDEPHALILLGDTPYIDSTDLAHQRRRRAEFWAVPELAALASRVPVYGTWDDHDFAANDQVGERPGIENSRRAFMEYHPQNRFGDGEGGVYSSFRHGPAEVFILDTRWFGDREALGEDPEVRSLLGRTQREWLIDGARRSTAPVKVLCCGMVWNDAVRPGKRDHWGTWHQERDAIFRALGEAEVKGVVLVSGDVHRPRVIRHVAAEELLGYAPIELVSSPLANHHIPAAGAPHPGLVWDAPSNSVALGLEIVPTEGAPEVTARFVGPKDAPLRVQELGAADLGYDEPK